MPFARPGQEPPKRKLEPPIITDAERYGGKKLSREEKLNMAASLLDHKRG